MVIDIVINMVDEKDFAFRLARLREKKDVSSRDMSLSMGQNPGYINNIETGELLLSLTGIFYIYEYLGVTPCVFLTQGYLILPSWMRLPTIKKLTDNQLDAIATLVRELIKR